MKKTKEFVTIDLKFIKAVDQIIKINKQLNIKPNNDSAIAKLIYPSNRGIISSVRARTKHVPHLALINFAKTFHVNMNYFYKPDELLGYKPTDHLPEHLKEMLSSKPVISTSTKASSGIFKSHKRFIDGLPIKQPNPDLTRVVKIDTMISNFASKIKEKHRERFFSIISHIKAKHSLSHQKVNLIAEKNAKELALLRQSYKEELDKTRKELARTTQELTASQKRENEMLRKYIHKIDLK